MEAKLFQVRDSGTHGFAFAVKLDAANALEADFIADAGFGGGELLVGTLGPAPNSVTYDKFHWRNGGGNVRADRTMFLVHGEIERRWDELVSGSVLDVTDLPHE